jgi:general secretion pathway protein H
MTLRSAQSGVTLIEMMIVLAVVGVATGAATLGLASIGRDNRAETAALRLAADMSLAVDLALIEGRAQTVVWDAAGYAVQGRKVALDASVTLARSDGLPDAVVIAPNGAGDAVAFILTGADADWRVVFDGFSVVVQP